MLGRKNGFSPCVVKEFVSKPSLMNLKCGVNVVFSLFATICFFVLNILFSSTFYFHVQDFDVKSKRDKSLF